MTTLEQTIVKKAVSPQPDVARRGRAGVSASQATVAPARNVAPAETVAPARARCTRQGGGHDGGGQPLVGTERAA